MLIKKTPESLSRDPTQPRKDFIEAEIRSLGDSMLALGQLQPILVRPNWTIIAGERRWLAAKLVGMKEVDVIVTDTERSDTKIRLSQLAENIHRADLSGYEKAIACRELMELNSDWQLKDLADHLHLDPSSVTRLMSVWKLIPEAVDSLKAGKISISDAYEISKLKPEDQPVLLNLKSGGASRNTLAQAGRKQRAAATPAVRAKKIKVPLPTGQVVTIAGDELSLEDAIEAMGEALKLAKSALVKGLNASTAVKVWADMAAAG